MERRPHKLFLLYDLKRWLPLLAILLWRWFGTDLTTPAAWLRDGAIGAGLVLYSVMRFFACRYRLGQTKGGETFGVRQGVVCRRTLHIQAADAGSVEIERSPIAWLLGGRRVRVNTAGLRRRSDAVLYLSADEVRRLFVLRDRAAAGRLRARFWPVFILAVSGSNAAVGLLTAVPLLRRLGTFLGEEIAPDAVGAVQQLLSAEIGAALHTAGNLLLWGWGIAALNTLLRYIGFYVTVQGEQLHIVSGLFTRRDVLIDRDKITAVELRQTLLMRVLGLYTAVITAAGYGRDRGARPVLVPAADPHTVHATLKQVLPSFPIRDTYVQVPRGAALRYLVAPIGLIAVSAVLWILGGAWHAPAFVAAVFGVWWCAVRWLGYKSAGLGLGEEAVTVRYPRGLALYQVQMPRKTVDHVTVTQSVWQRRRGLCTVTVRCFGEKKRRHRVWGLPYEAVNKEKQALLE
ncbi:MAG: PH domain-containing protein [Clostridia bacterium]|nr:PH domain-containing protein [Clostridia bacterium]